MKVLILKPSSLGDVVQALPLLRLIKRRFPDAQVSWWVSSDLVSLFDGDPDLTRVVPFSRKAWASPRHWGEFVRTLRDARSERYDWVLDLQGLARSAAFTWFANGEVSVGLDDMREGASLVYDFAVQRPSPQAHAVEWYLEVLDAMGVPRGWDFEWLPVRPELAGEVEVRLQGHGGPLVTLCPGARWMTKRWPVEYFGELMARIAKRHSDARFAIIGGRGDRDMGETLAKADPERCIDLTGRTSLLGMVEWIRRSRMLITNDTGPMHVGAALRLPVVGLFGPTDPRQTGPFGQIDKAIQPESLTCAPCRKSVCRRDDSMECLTGVAVEKVLAQVFERWNEGETIL